MGKLPAILAHGDSGQAEFTEAPASNSEALVPDAGVESSGFIFRPLGAQKERALIKRVIGVLMVVAAGFLGSAAWSGADQEVKAERPAIRIVNPPEQGFYSKVLDFRGIPIKG